MKGLGRNGRELDCGGFVLGRDGRVSSKGRDVVLSFATAWKDSERIVNTVSKTSLFAVVQF